MTAEGQAAVPEGVPVLRPVPVRQMSAGLAVTAAVAAVLSLGLSVSSTWNQSDESFLGDHTVTRVAGGESVIGWDGSDEWSWVSLVWTAPVVLAAVLLSGAAVAALLGARTDRPGPWTSAAQWAALGGAGLLAGVAGVQAVVAWSDVAVARGDNFLAALWGPAPVVLAVAALLAGAAALTARRGRAKVLAVIRIPMATSATTAAPEYGAAW